MVAAAATCFGPSTACCSQVQNALGQVQHPVGLATGFGPPLGLGPGLGLDLGLGHNFDCAGVTLDQGANEKQSHIYIYIRIVRWVHTGRNGSKKYFAIGSFGWPAVARLACPRWWPSGRSARPRRSETIGNRKVWRFRRGRFLLNIWPSFGRLGFCSFWIRPNFRSRFSSSAGGAKVAYI